MTTLKQIVKAEFKRVPTDGSGSGTALIYSWIARDTAEPVLDPGSLYLEREWVPLLWAHRMDTPEASVGSVFNGRTSEEGFLVDFKLDLTSDLAQKVYESLLRETIGEFSVGFGWEEKDLYIGPDGRAHLRRAELVEASVVMAGASRGTRLVRLKSVDSPPAPPAPQTVPETDAAFLSRMNKAHPAAAHAITVAAQKEARVADEARRHALAVVEFEQRSLDLAGQPKTQIVLDPQMRPLVDEAGARKARAEHVVTVPGEGETVRLRPWVADRAPAAATAVDEETVSVPVVGKPDKDEFIGVETAVTR